MRKYRSDVWDEGNYLTRFHEVYEQCGKCNGTGKVTIEVHKCCGVGRGWCTCTDEESEDVVQKEILCDLCGGDGELVYYI